MVVLLWICCGGVFSWELSNLIEKVLDHHKPTNFNSLHSKFGFLISSKLHTKYERVLEQLSRKPVLGEDNLSEDIRVGERLGRFHK